jgi:general secretion pathway protein D
LNTRSIDTGTSNDIEVRRSAVSTDDFLPQTSTPPPTSNTSAANAASAMVQQLKQQASPPVPGQTTPAAGTVPPTTPAAAPAPGSPATPAAKPATPNATSGPPVSLIVVPPDSTQTLGSNFVASVYLSNAHDVYSVPMQIQFDPKVLQLVNVDTGGLLGGDGQPVALVHRDDGNGMVTISASRPPGVSGVNGEGQVCILTFKAVGAGESKITLVKVGAQNSVQASLPAVGSAAVVHVK